jgi:hypothetical protein
MRIVIAVIALFHVALGVLALVAPGTFYDQIGHYGSENTHYIGDVGAFYLAAGIALAATIVRPAWRAPLLWLFCLWYGLHALNHAFDVGEARSDARGIFDTVALAVGAGFAGWLARVSGRPGRAAGAP